MPDATTEIEGTKKTKESSRWTNLTAVLGSLTALMVLVSTGLGIFAARSNQTAEQATDKVSDLSSEAQDLQQSVDTLTQANDGLNEKNASLEEENAQLRAGIDAPTTAADELVIETVRVEAGDYKRVAPWEYELAGSRTLDFRFYWTTIANTGQLDGTDCVVVATVKNMADNSIFDVHRTQTCSLTGWVGEELPAGNYLVTVEVQAVTGAKGAGQATVKVLP